MIPAIVVGRTHATVKDPSLQGVRLLVVQPIDRNTQPDGFPLIVVDAVGARTGDRVMMTSDGPYARLLLKTEKTPVRWAIIGLADDVDDHSASVK
jgi:ethanolamine utilization protein EutN